MADTEQLSRGASAFVGFDQARIDGCRDDLRGYRSFVLGKPEPIALVGLDALRVGSAGATHSPLTPSASYHEY